MISKKERSEFRQNLFRHLDGIAVAPVAYSLLKKGVLDFLLEHKSVTLSSVSSHFKANEGYLNVALRVLCSQGWLSQKIDNQKDLVNFSVNEFSEFAFSQCHLYEDAVHLLKFTENFHSRRFQVKPFLVMEKIFGKLIDNYEIDFSDNPDFKNIQQQILKHIEGIVLGPTIVHLGMSGMFHKYFMEASFKAEEFHNDADSFGRLLDIFTKCGWFDKNNATYQFTNLGVFYAKRASAYGVTVSYIPTFRKLDDLIFGNPLVLKPDEESNKELHVDRAMNVWGSGGAHSGYFKVVDEIIMDLFNKPIEEQPKGILDMGCGNGAFLIHLFSVIEQHTLRGKLLDEHPLILVGVDYNETALKISRKNLIQADIWAKVIWGDIGNPDLLADDLLQNYGVNLKDLLNVRTFLDHNRIWQEPLSVHPQRKSSSSGAFAFKGLRINNNLAEDSLLEHMKKWEPFVSKFGLLIIELHTVSPQLVASNLGRTAATAYDATHGFSDQYIIELDVFIKVMKEAGLYPVMEKFRKFPNSDLATISVNIFKGST